MTTHPFIQPPRIAAWLVDLFTPYEQAESISGDLLEEFSELATKSGASSARSWYWRQSMKTIVHLFGAGFRVAPWSVFGAVVGGFLLLGIHPSLPDRAIQAVLDFHRHNVIPYYTDREFKDYLFWLNTSLVIGYFINAMLVGCIMALMVKGTEMVATMTLTLVEFILIAVMLVYRFVSYQPNYGLTLSLPIAMLGYPFMILLGGGIVRKYRSAASRRLSGA